MDQRRHTLLVVDDESDVLDSLRHLFHRDYRVLTATSGDEALKLLAENPVHVLLSDQRMPGMTGDELLGRARQLYPDTIRLLFTGYADIQAVTNAVNQGGIFRYIHKPWDSLELESVVRQAADQYDLLAERRRLLTELQASNSQLTRANRELAESSQLKTAFLEVASHEFNTPITIIRGMSELLGLLNPNREAHEREIVSQISGATRHLARLVATTLEMIESGGFRSPLHVAPTDLAQLIHGAFEQVMPFIRARRLKLHDEVPEDLGTFEIDAEKISDALLNLLSNAIKFTPDGGEISLRAQLVSDDAAEIEVADRGIGLEPRALEHLFEPFFTEFDPSRHSTGDFGFNQRGLGLGLSLVKKFIDLHGGHVTAESTLGDGTRIVLRLPRRPCPPTDSGVQFPRPNAQSVSESVEARG